MNLRWIAIVFLSSFFYTGQVGQAQFGFFRSAPEVEEISAKELYQTLLSRSKEVEKAKQSGVEPAKSEFVIVDVRSPEEYQISMIPGAITKQDYELNAAAYANVTVIPYCTVGGRSAQYARDLAAKGVKVLNFKESIIGWCQDKLPLVTVDVTSTNQVHTYTSRNKVPAEYKAVY